MKRYSNTTTLFDCSFQKKGKMNTEVPVCYVTKKHPVYADFWNSTWPWSTKTKVTSSVWIYLVFKIGLSTNKLYRFVLYFYPSLKKMHNFFVYYFRDFTKCTWKKNGKMIWECLFVYSNTWGHFRFCWSWSRGISEIGIKTKTNI
jgi:hypothetical protein